MIFYWLLNRHSDERNKKCRNQSKEINKEIYFVIGAWGDCNWCKNKNNKIKLYLFFYSITSNTLHINKTLNKFSSMNLFFYCSVCFSVSIEENPSIFFPYYLISFSYFHFYFVSFHSWCYFSSIIIIYLFGISVQHWTTWIMYERSVIHVP